MRLAATILINKGKIEDSITTIKSINGGDISSAYRIDTSKNSYFLKQNTSPIALAMFQTEAYGLNTIAKTNVLNIDTGKVRFAVLSSTLLYNRRFNHGCC